MKITTFAAPSAQELKRDFADSRYDFVSIHGNCNLAVDDLLTPNSDAALHGATSCLGAMTQAGVQTGLTAFVIDDPEGAYGTAMCPNGADLREAARTATRGALRDADRLGERPEIIWVSATPGAEEEVLAGIEDVVGPDVPIIGGSAADNDVSGQWFVFDRTGQSEAGVVVSALFPSRPVSFAYQNGYSPTQHTGVVTRATGRCIQEIDHRPAWQVYSDWTRGDVQVDPYKAEQQTILSDSTLWPLGREISQVGSVPFYLLAHPANAHPDGDIDLFASVAEGEVLTLMNGTVDGLVDRAGRVARLARNAGHGMQAPIAGALMIYCGGCMLTVRDQLPDVVSGVNTALDGAPFLGAFTFGEQGALVNAGNRHGNLMISCIVFGA